MLKKILIANRGEIACRVIKTARRLGIPTVAVYSDADRDALHVQMADEAVHIGAAPANQSYLLIDRILDAIKATGADSVHPGYGFLSENAKFAEALDKAGVIFIGPPQKAIEAMGDKITSKKIAAEANVSTVPGFMGLIEDAEEAVKISRQIGYPVMIKASAGGGGKGMRIARSDEEAREGFQSSKNEAAGAFGDDRIFIEKFVERPRHIEIQVLADKHGNCVYLNERECSIQRRNQKVVEEAPSPFLDEETRRAMGEQSVALAKAVGYQSAGTVEFIVDAERNFYFLEMNTRLQVEHPVTELITGLDLVEQMIRVASGEPLSFAQADVKREGWAIENRLYAEDPLRGFLPSTGRLSRYRPPAEEGGVRVDTGVIEGGEISRFYDPMIAKLVTYGATRGEAIEKMRVALDEFEVEGIGHNLPFVAAVMDHPRFISGDISTAFIAEEYPDGFKGAELPHAVLEELASIGAAAHLVLARRAADMPGALFGRTYDPGTLWVVTMGEARFETEIEDAEDMLFDVRIGEKVCEVDLAEWTPGEPVLRARVDGTERVVKMEARTEGFRMRYRGAELNTVIRRPHIAELAALMPEKPEPDLSKFLLCPMPGLVVSIAVAEGDEVEAGQVLATVEAMKMENVLRAQKKAKVAKVAAKAGDSLAVDAVILEFE